MYRLPNKYSYSPLLLTTKSLQPNALFHPGTAIAYPIFLRQLSSTLGV